MNLLEILRLKHLLDYVDLRLVDLNSSVMNNETQELLEVAANVHLSGFIFN